MPIISISDYQKFQIGKYQNATIIASRNPVKQMRGKALQGIEKLKRRIEVGRGSNFDFGIIA